MEFLGKDKTISAPATFVAKETFIFGERAIPKGSRVEQFETQNFGWTMWVDPNTGNKHLAKE